ncbi:MAG: radical SAM family heme chaperone HemW [Planctomycetota bacterium]
MSAPNTPLDLEPTYNQPALFSSPRSAYLHLPFCRYHCGYCNFSVAAGRDYLIPRYVTALGLELGRLPQLLTLETLFLGGGTPSRLDPNQLAQLKELIQTRLRLDPGAEVTLEANPSDVTSEWTAAAVEFGATRVSLGAQSFRSEKLRQLERDHDAATIRQAVELLKRAELTVSIDLIFAAPGELTEQWKDDLRSALELPIDHLSTYELTYEKGTRFWNERHAGRLEEQDEDQRSELYRLTLETLAVAGWEHYEISSFARSGSRCRHNLVYWSGRPYLAFGAGASRFLGGTRSTNHFSTMRYLKLVEAGQDPTADLTQLTKEELARELLAIGLRQIQGLRESSFLETTGVNFQTAAGPQLAELIGWGLVELSGEGRERLLRLTARGLYLYDAIASRIATSK